MKVRYWIHPGARGCDNTNGPSRFAAVGIVKIDRKNEQKNKQIRLHSAPTPRRGAKNKAENCATNRG